MYKERIDLDNQTFLLRGTGWDIDGQMQMIRDTSTETATVQEWKSKVIEKTTSDLEGLYWEYLVKSPVLPFDLSYGDNRVVCPKYGNKPLPDIVSEEERKGSIKQSMQSLEDRLIHAADGETFVLISPPGWSGYECIEYPDTQIYYYQKLGSEIRSLTLLCPDAKLFECETLYQKLSGSEIDLANKDTEKRILSLTSTIIPQAYLEPHDIVYSLEQILGKKLPHMYDALNSLPEIDGQVQSCIYDLQQFISENIFDSSEASQTLLMYKIGQTVLDMKSVLSRGRKPQTAAEYAQSYEEFSMDDGCNGGGTIYTRVDGMQNAEEEFLNWGVCAMNKKDACISPNKGKKERVGQCMICPACHYAFKSGKTFEDIREIAASRQEREEEILPTVEIEGSVFVKAAAAFVGALFTA